MGFISTAGRLISAYCLTLLIFSCSDDAEPGSEQSSADAGDATSGAGGSAGQQTQAGNDAGGAGGASGGNAGEGSGGAGGNEPDGEEGEDDSDAGLADAQAQDGAGTEDSGEGNDASDLDLDSGSGDDLDGSSFPDSGGGPSDPLVSFSDEFDDASTLGDWLRIYETEQWNANQLQTFNIDQADGGTSRQGFATMVPYANAWFGDYRGELTYKVISGDFMVTARLEVSNLADTGAPNSLYSLAGLMVREPRAVTPGTWTAGGENYVLIAAGAAGTAANDAIYLSNTTISTSVVTSAPVTYSEVDLRIIRLGQYLIILKRETGSAWTVHQRFTRNDFGAAVQVGMVAMGDWTTCNGYTEINHNQTVITTGTPDLLAQYDFVRFASVNPPPGWSGLDLANSSAISDVNILAVLGAD
jgi:hypothetical protein